MKNFIIFFIANVIFTSSAWAQMEKTAENSWALPASKEVSMNLKFASDIQVTTHSSNTVKLKTYLKVSNEELFKVHTMTATEGSELRVNTDYDFEDRKDYEDQCWNCNDDWDRNCFCVQVRYELMVPANTELNLETISGDIKLSGLTGNLNIKTISGDVETQLANMSGRIYLKSISGAVDVALKTNQRADLRFKSVTGEIYTDFDDVTLDENSSSFSKRLNTSLNGGGSLLELETVSGDIFFRKGR